MKAYRQWNNKILYVSDFPINHDNHREDWGYSPKVEQAIDLSPYWMRRFGADCRRVNSLARFI